MAKYVGYKRPKDTKKTIKHLLVYLGYHKWSFVLVALLVFISAGANIMGTYLLKPVINKFIVPEDTTGLIRAVISMGVMYLCGALSTFAYNRLMVVTSQKVIKEIRNDLFAHTQKLPLSYFDAHSHGELMSRFTNDVDTVQEAMNSSFAMIIQSFMQEMMAGQKVEKVFNHEAKDFERFCEMNESLRRESTNALTFAGRMVPTIVTLSYFNYAVSACVGGLMAIKGLLDLGTLSAYLVYVRQSAMPLNQFTQQVNFLLSALSGAERIFEMMDEKPEIDEGTVTLCNAVRTPDGGLKECEERTGLFAWRVPERMTMPDGSLQKQFNVVEDGAVHDAAEATSLVELKGDVRFNEVVFGYTPEKRVLNGISLFAKPGQKIAFVGSTGAGKTTIVNLVNRFYEIQSGTITYDGIDIKDIKKDDLRRSLAMVIQETHLFTGTIADNIRYGNPHATDEEVVEAAKIANADSFIKWLPEGYNTMLYSDGGNLSQGQRQLLAIARAAAAKPPVLILDEATSSVDTRTERLIEKGMDAIMEDRTVFVIAHRLSTVRNSEAIMVLEKGEIIERGNHAELLAQEGRYYRLYMGQFELE